MPMVCADLGSVAQSDFGPHLFDLRLLVGTECGISKLDRHFLQVSGELERYMIILADRRAGVFADVQRFICGDAERDASFDPALGHLLSVYHQRRGAALAESATVILEVDQDCMVAGGKRVGAGNCVAIDAHGVVVENRLPSEQV